MGLVDVVLNLYIYKRQVEKPQVMKREINFITAERSVAQGHMACQTVYHNAPMVVHT